jgi:3-oxoacyl-[acyl-carrier protein] reductase
MSSSLSGKIAIVTGGSRGIGAAICRRLARDGARVVVNYSAAAAPAEAVVAEVRAAGGEAVVVKADLTDPAGAKALLDGAAAAFGGARPDILVANAGAYDARPIDQIDLAHYQKLFDLNVRGPVLVAAEMARRMNDNGRIVCISSAAARQAAAGAGVYAASKAAVEALVRCWAVDLGPRGITVNAVAPGTTGTEAVNANFPDAAKQAVIAKTSLARLGRPNDIADVVAFLCSDDARWVTGTHVDATGGVHG